MADRRIRMPKDKADFVKQLTNGDGTSGPFRLQADVLAFAASLGANRDCFTEFSDTTKDPIRYEVFERQGYDTLINLLAIYKEKDPLVLADNDEMEDRRATIFEEYANCGLQLLQEELKGSVDYARDLLLLLAKERTKKDRGADEGFDLANLIE